MIFVYWMTIFCNGLMENRKIVHVVAFNVPYPPNYGGIIDIYYKLKALNNAGIGILLHCFVYERGEAKELESICQKIYYYKRKAGISYILNKLPYIVVTRQIPELEKNLLADNFPVIFEGLHTTALLQKCKNAGKKVYVRTHNIEDKYYRMLAKSEKNLLRKIYLRSESKKLGDYESILQEADNLLAISTTDTAYFKEKYGECIHVPAFHQHEELTIQKGKGDYLLFHGNLSVPENENALIYLVKNVLSRIKYRVIIAGKDPGKNIKRMCQKYPNLQLVSNPVGEEMDKLVGEAQINLLYTYQPTGLKLKLLHSLFGGRHCLANPLMLSGSDLENLCQIYHSPVEAISLIDELMKTSFSEADIEKRKSGLTQYSNTFGAGRIIEILKESGPVPDSI